MKTTILAAAMLGIIASALLGDNTNDIPMGELGYRLGKYLTIEGVREDGMKTGVKTLRVDTINGNRLTNAIPIWIENVQELPVKTRCVLKGYESGRMVGTPVEVARAENSTVPQTDWHFQHYFLVTTIVSPAELKTIPVKVKP